MAESEDKQEILLESGTNELEVLVFSLGPTRYGVNVSKVREVIGHVKLVRIPMTHAAVIGVFKLRDSIISLVDLQRYFAPGTPSKAAQRNVILMEFNNFQIGFLVDSVDRIYRMSWSKVQPMPRVQDDLSAVITSVCDVDGKLVLLIDFEKITFDINGDQNLYRVQAGLAQSGSFSRSSQHVLLAEDSPTIREAIRTNIVQSGYTQTTVTGNGSEAWALLEASVAVPGARPFDIVVTDIEMPQMDGLHLCKRIKEHPQLKYLPVIVFSSLVSNTNLKKCLAVGADAAITKPEMTRVVGLLDELLAGKPPSIGAVAGPERVGAGA